MVGNAPRETPWVSERFRELSEALIRSFEPAGFQGGAMLWHRTRGFDGTHPEDKELRALVQAVTFAALDTSDRHARDRSTARYSATTENGELFLQPIDEKEGRISHRRGGALRRLLNAGWRIGAQTPPLAEAVLPIGMPLQVSAMLARAIFSAVLDPGPRAKKIQNAVQWHQSAMVNSEVITTAQRLIFLKTGFESLLRESRARPGATRLRRRFENCTKGQRDLLPSAGVLWAPNEKKLARMWDGEAEIRSELEDWFLALADARNLIIHKGEARTFLYDAPPERPLSQYAGHLVEIGERVLREAIKATIGPEVLLCGVIARRQVEAEALREDEQVHEATLGPAGAPTLSAEPKVPVDPPRQLEELLGFLDCSAANRIVLSYDGGSGHGATLEIAREGARKNEDRWGATAGLKTISISRAERDLLAAEGAEDELPDFWAPCP
jgi:hypothetical protein